MNHLLRCWSWRSFVINSSGSRTCFAQSNLCSSPLGGKGRSGTHTWQYEDVHEGLAVIETCRHDTVCPQPLGPQLIHFPASGNGVAASHHPVIGGRCHNHPDPPYKTADKSGQVQAGGHHVDPLVGQAGRERTRRGSAKPAGKLPAAGTCCEQEGWGFGRTRSLIRHCCRHSLPLPSAVPGRG